jgi:hypothetical protein
MIQYFLAYFGFLYRKQRAASHNSSRLEDWKSRFTPALLIGRFLPGIAPESISYSILICYPVSGSTKCPKVDAVVAGKYYLRVCGNT